MPNSLLETHRVTNIQSIQGRDDSGPYSRHVGINHRGFEVFMTGQFLYFTDVSFSLKQMGGRDSLLHFLPPEIIPHNCQSTDIDYTLA